MINIIQLFLPFLNYPIEGPYSVLYKQKLEKIKINPSNIHLKTDRKRRTPFSIEIATDEFISQYKNQILNKDKCKSYVKAFVDITTIKTSYFCPNYNEDNVTDVEKYAIEWKKNMNLLFWSYTL